MHCFCIGREDWPHREPPNHLHPRCGSEGRVEEHSYPDHRIDRIGDPDCTGRHVLYGILVKKDPNCMAVWIFFVTLPSKKAYPMITTLIIGLLIPLLGTMLGSAFVFFMCDEMSARLQNSLLGFASGVMIAASMWC